MSIARRAMAGIVVLSLCFSTGGFVSAFAMSGPNRTTAHKFQDYLTAQRTTGRRQRGDLAREGLTDRSADVPLGSGFAGPRPTRSDRFERHRDGYDGSRYWWGGDCWPTEPGGCDW
jgi:hypothetical protein